MHSLSAWCTRWYRADRDANRGNRYHPVKRQGEGISYYTLSFILATAIGPFLGLLMIQLASINMIFITCTILTGIGILLTLFTTLPKVVIKKNNSKN
nr:MFS transporter [Thalassobacillus sp. C254]